MARRAEIERLLPAVVRRTAGEGTPLAALLDVMEGLHAPSESALGRVDAVLDPRRTPDAFVTVLARWVDLDRLFEEEPYPRRGGTSRAPISTGLGHLRELTARAAYLSKWRGTARGLILFLETATGMRGFRIEERIPGTDGTPQPFHVRVVAPEAARPHRALVTRIVESEKPAYVTYELRFEA